MFFVLSNGDFICIGFRVKTTHGSMLNAIFQASQDGISEMMNPFRKIQEMRREIGRIFVSRLESAQTLLRINNYSVYPTMHLAFTSRTTKSIYSKNGRCEQTNSNRATALMDIPQKYTSSANPKAFVYRKFSRSWLLFLGFLQGFCIRKWDGVGWAVLILPKSFEESLEAAICKQRLLALLAWLLKTALIRKHEFLFKFLLGVTTLIGGLKLLTWLAIAVPTIRGTQSPPPSPSMCLGNLHPCQKFFAYCIPVMADTLCGYTIEHSLIPVCHQ